MNVTNTANTVADLSNSTKIELNSDKAERSALHKAEAENDLAKNTARIEEQSKTSISEASKTQAMTPKQLEKVAQQLQDFMGEMNRSLEFLVDKDSGRDVIKVLDKSTGDLVKQYPSEEVLGIISKLSNATGNLIDTEI
ncbi:flagellar protein FlaG [Colwellia sp. MB02u-9]|uniref:flagellar protein FlaG n=1 Tax=Colwellia sp. MB02u-9 TaxID=2759823 RepID=UPI0015F7348C|nr:flagellar protein FlaG [Colwellia sp. MB02u-9]MBA6294465.1 flagellar protein FlaG [Colwellia sp. MB02u-9]